MKQFYLKQTSTKVLFTMALSVMISFVIKAANPPFEVKNDLFDQTEKDSLGLTRAAGTETYTIFAPVETGDQFSNGAVMTHFKGHFYCQWQSSLTDEDALDTKVAYSRSADGKNWDTVRVIAPSIDNGYCSSGGWWTSGDSLIAFVNVWPASVSPRGGFTYYSISTDGLSWTPIQPALMADGDTLRGIFEQDPHALPNGRIVNAVHFQRGLTISPVYTDDPSGLTGWTRAEYPNLTGGDISQEIEPSWFLRSDDTLVMIFRDQNSSFRKLASTSGDNGETWSKAVLTLMPDARTKQSAGNFGDGIAYMTGNPVNNKLRSPLAITLSPNGKFFNTAYVLRKTSENQTLRYEGKAKRAGFHYPKTMVWNDTVFVSYTTNKEDVEYTRIPVSSLILDTTMSNPPVVDPPIGINNISESINNEIKIYTDAKNLVNISSENAKIGVFRIYNLNGQLIYSEKSKSQEITYNMNQHPSGTYIIHVFTDKAKKTQMIIKR